MLSQLKTALAKVVKNAFIFLIITTGNLSIAALQPIQDEELSAYAGQAVIHINQDQDTSQNLNYTKIQFGLDIETNATIGKLDQGNYSRNGSEGSDILMENVGLGYIDKNGNMVPMKIKDPYIQLARDSNTNDIKGIRIGFGSIQGLMTGIVGSLTGDVRVDIKDNTLNMNDGIYYATDADNPTLGGIADRVIGGMVAATTFDSASPINTKARLVNFETGLPQTIRTTYIGVPNGHSLDITGLPATTAIPLTLALIAPLPLPGVGAIALSSLGVSCPNFYCDNLSMTSGGQFWPFTNPCHILLDTAVCYPLAQFKSFYFGQKPEGNGKGSGAEGVYLSLQNDGFTWSEDEEKQQSLASGFNFVAPDGAITVNFIEATKGTNPGRTKYVSDPFQGHDYYK